MKKRNESAIRLHIRRVALFVSTHNLNLSEQLPVFSCKDVLFRINLTDVDLRSCEKL